MVRTQGQHRGRGNEHDHTLHPHDRAIARGTHRRDGRRIPRRRPRDRLGVARRTGTAARRGDRHRDRQAVVAAGGIGRRADRRHVPPASVLRSAGTAVREAPPRRRAHHRRIRHRLRHLAHPGLCRGDGERGAGTLLVVVGAVGGGDRDGRRLRGLHLPPRAHGSRRGGARGRAPCPPRTPPPCRRGGARRGGAGDRGGADLHRACRSLRRRECDAARAPMAPSRLAHGGRAGRPRLRRLDRGGGSPLRPPSREQCRRVVGVHVGLRPRPAPGAGQPRPRRARGLRDADGGAAGRCRSTGGPPRRARRVSGDLLLRAVRPRRRGAHLVRGVAPPSRRAARGGRARECARPPGPPVPPHRHRDDDHRRRGDAPGVGRDAGRARTPAHPGGPDATRHRRAVALHRERRRGLAPGDRVGAHATARRRNWPR